MIKKPRHNIISALFVLKTNLKQVTPEIMKDVKLDKSYVIMAWALFTIDKQKCWFCITLFKIYLIFITELFTGNVKYNWTAF